MPDRQIADRIAPGLRLGETFATYHYSVTAGDVERFVTGSGDRTGPWQSGLDYISGALAVGTPAPPTYFLALDPYERGDLGIDAALDALEYPATGGGNAWNEVRYRRPIRVGDEITVEVRFVDVFEKDGSTGRLLFRIRENRYFGSDGEVIADTRCAHIRSFDVSGATGCSGG